MSTSILRRVTAAAGVLALGAIAAVAAVAPAQAVTLPGNIDPDQPRSLTIHKFALGPESPQGIGTGQQVNVPGTPLAGAEFTVQLVEGIDLETSAGWSEAAALSPGAAANRLDPDVELVGVTGTDGVVSFSSETDELPIGLYLVTETELPDEATNGVAPFLVTLPFPTGPGGTPANEWIYDVHVYPKNAVTETTKTRVAPEPGSVEARNPDLVRWEISAGIPTLAEGDTLDTFTFVDTFPTALEYLATGPTGVAPTSLTVTNSAGLPQTFVLNEDYTLVFDAASSTLTLDFTDDGLLALSGFQGGDVTLSVLTRATEIPGSGNIVNSATSTINGATETVTGSMPIGQLTVFAFHAEGNVRTPLAGATYQVFLTESDALLGRNPIFIDGISSWTTDETGYVEIPIITPGAYWVREVTPPAGWQLPTPSQVVTQVVAGPSSVTEPVQNYVEFDHNQVSPSWALPLTGGDGALWFGVGGGALVAIALGAAVVVARRRAAGSHPAA